jgi:hypothetical protein
LALYEERLRFYHYSPVLEELQRLEWNPLKNKVDHPPHGSKDVADALAGCVFTLSQERASEPIPFLSSIPVYGSATESTDGLFSSEFENMGGFLPFFKGIRGDDW